MACLWGRRHGPRRLHVYSRGANWRKRFEVCCASVATVRPVSHPVKARLRSYLTALRKSKITQTRNVRACCRAQAAVDAASAAGAAGAAHVGSELAVEGGGEHADTGAGGAAVAVGLGAAVVAVAAVLAVERWRVRRQPVAAAPGTLHTGAPVHTQAQVTEV